MRIAIVALWLMSAQSQAELLDRLAVTVDERLITLSDVLAEIRIAAFLDGSVAELAPQKKREAAERLIEFHLLQRDMELTRFPAPSPAETQEFFEQVRKSRAPDETVWRAELARYRITEAALREHLARRLAVLRYVEFRFRPEVQLSEGDIQHYLRDRVMPLLRPAAGDTALPTEEARRAAEAALTAERVNQLVDRWLEDARRRSKIRYREAAFQ